MTHTRRVKAWLTVAVCLIGGLPQLVSADSGSWWKTRDQRGAELLQSGDAAAASEVFRNSEWRGISHYRNGNFAEAQKEFSASGDPQSLYNEGTAAARAGDYQTAVEKFEQVAEADPSHADAAHNLDIARQLLEKQQQSSDESQQGDEQGEDQGEEQGADQGDSQNSDGSEQSGDQSQSGDQQQGEQQEGSESQQNDGAGDQNQSDNGGELSTTAEDAEASAEENKNQSSPGPSDQEQAEQEQAATAQAGDEQAGEPGEQSASNADPTQTAPISESEQATEQWMRRIPDDPSQLLRNKIKLNHMIQHENVRDLAEPW